MDEFRRKLIYKNRAKNGRRRYRCGFHPILPSHFRVDLGIDFLHSLGDQFVLALTVAIVDIPLGPFPSTGGDLFPFELGVVGEAGVLVFPLFLPGANPGVTGGLVFRLKPLEGAAIGSHRPQWIKSLHRPVFINYFTRAGLALKVFRVLLGQTAVALWAGWVSVFVVRVGVGAAVLEGRVEEAAVGPVVSRLHSV